MDRPGLLTPSPALIELRLSPEERFARGAAVDRRKRLGQFFTPISIARAMTTWCCRHRPRRMLDPAVGPGIFPACALELPDEHRPVEVDCYDVDAQALSIARDRLTDWNTARVRVHLADFLARPPRDRFDAIVCNPPYIRHHDAKVPPQVYENLEAEYGLRLSRMTNVYALFLLRIARLLSETGRAAVITPAEFLNADFGVAVKSVLMQSGVLRGFVIFDHAASVFDGIMTTAAITLLDARAGSTCDVRFIHVDAESDLPEALDAMDGGGESCPVVLTQPDPREKWATGQAEFTASADARGLRPLSDFASCSRGIATGANDFFTLTRAEAHEWQLPDAVLRPCVMKAPQVPGSHWTDQRMTALIDAGKKALLLDAAAHVDDPAVQRYVAHGESMVLHQRYLTRHRRPWFAIERRAPADIWVATFGRGRIRFVLNQSSALHLTAFHGLYLREEHRPFAVHLLAFLLSEAGAAECRRNQRVYGDGLLKFEPRDVERLNVPDFRSMSAERLAEIEAMGKLIIAGNRGDLTVDVKVGLATLFE